MSDELVSQRVRLAKRDVVFLGAILAGEDHLASIHGESAATEERVTISVMTTSSRAAELARWLEELALDLQIEIVQERVDLRAPGVDVLGPAPDKYL